jgi:hypothetical protein
MDSNKLRLSHTATDFNKLSQKRILSIQKSMKNQGFDVLEKQHMDASNDMNELVAGYEPPQSRAQSIDFKAKTQNYYEDTPDFLRILDNPKY